MTIGEKACSGPEPEPSCASWGDFLGSRGALWVRLAPDTEKPAGRGADGLTVSVCQSAKLGADNDAEQNALRHQADRDAGDLRNACHCDCLCVALDGGAVRSPPICALQHSVSTATPAIAIALNATVKCRVVN